MFKWLSPSYWFLSKTEKKKLKITNSSVLSPLEKEKALILCDDSISEDERELKIANIQKDNNEISTLEYWEKIHRYSKGMEKDIALLELLRAKGSISTHEFNSEVLKLKTQPGLELELALLDNDLACEKISVHDYELRKIDLDPVLDKRDKEIKKVEYSKANGLISNNEADSSLSTQLRQPFIAVESTFDSSKGIHGLSFSFIWNDFWVKELHEAGYRGTEEEMMDKWFSDICRSVLFENSLRPDDTVTQQGFIRSIVENDAKYIG